MDTCTYDNPDTMRRELWCKGSVLLSVSADLISQKDAHPRDWPFTTRKFSPGRVEGNPDALAERALFDCGLPVTILGTDCYTKAEADAAIDAARSQASPDAHD